MYNGICFADICLQFSLTINIAYYDTILGHVFNRDDESNSLYLESATDLYSLGASGNNGYPQYVYSFSQICIAISAKYHGETNRVVLKVFFLHSHSFGHTTNAL
jgi:hypothetical protein